MACERIDSLVTPFIDGELPEADRCAVEDHLRACPPCHSRVVAEREVQALIRASGPALKRTAAPDALHASCWALARFRPEADGRPSYAPLAVSGATPGGGRAALPARLAPYA